MSGSTPRRVALLGAESTGKSTLAGWLERALPGYKVSEYLREFCDENDRVPIENEQSVIAHTQLVHERRTVEAARRDGLGWVVCDTTPLMTALYSIDCFGDRSLLEPALRAQAGYDATLVCLPDLEWEADGIQRQDPETRERIHDLLLSTLEAHGLRWAPVGGTGLARLANALSILRSIR